ncbi:MAG: glycosyltransferase [Lunatimonas sp.]|uniref:glycosyltransferase n=1 Tax=Lunatimonas sp. TaxID=2060141 RepID=UPI00263AFD23|nr:glycosyltransferase [Lunatimonas sp.]MCC5935944.1 glycosyltransferase [Lunatimonas sp.]
MSDISKKLKIAFLVERFPKLSETFILNQLTYLVKAGHEVDIFPAGRSGEKMVHDEINRLRLLTRTYYPPIVPQNKIGAWLKFTLMVNVKPTVRTLVKFLKSQDFYNKQEILRRFYLISLFYPFISKNKYDIIHCHFGPTGLRAVFVRSLGLLEGKMLTTFYGYDITHQAMGKNYYQDLIAHCDKYIVISNYIVEKAASVGFERDKMVVLPLGINTEEYTPSGRKVGIQHIRLLSVARLVEKKGLYYAISAFHLLMELYPNIRYDIVGEGELMVPLKELVADLELRDRVIFHGARTKVDIIEFYRNADIFVLPSITGSDGNSEGQGLVLQEAQAMQLPVVATLHNGIPEGVIDEITGYLVPERDIEALKTKMKYLIDNENVRKTMGKNGREYVLRNFDNVVLGEKLELIYSEILKLY